MKKISGVIMDWAGTAVDYGCFAPLNAFLKVFSEEKGIDITYRQAREPMGLLKIDHIKAILSMPEVNEKFRALYKRDWNKGDVDEMYASFEKHFVRFLEGFHHSDTGSLGDDGDASRARYKDRLYDRVHGEDDGDCPSRSRGQRI